VIRPEQHLGKAIPDLPVAFLILMCLPCWAVGGGLHNLLRTVKSGVQNTS
jgi:hypothetical protein